MNRVAASALRVAFKLRYRREAVERSRRRRNGDTGVPSVAVVYVYPTVGDVEHDAAARRFASTYKEFPPLAEHALHVVFNGAEPSSENLAVFAGLEFQAHQHDDTGWDIGAFQAAASRIECDLMVFLGGNSYFKRAGWLKRMVEATRAHGDGLYGASASYERDPHVRTNAFWCDPMLVRAYPLRVRTDEDRYRFEASRVSITRMAASVGLGCWLVTWDGEYGRGEWRTPPNIFRRGDQSNSLAFDSHFDMYAHAGLVQKATYEQMAGF